VSQAQLEHFPNESQILKKIFINPVSLNLTINPPKYDRNRPNSIGFVGRIENDRGLGDLMIILDKLRSLNSDIKIVIAGKGKKSKFLIRKLSKIMPRSRILYLKHLDPEGMTKAWSKIGVLLSTAKTESYGRVMREAACYGIPVISVENSGSLLLSREIPKGWLEFVDPSESSESIANKFHKTRMQKTSSIFLRHTLREENMNIEILIASWIGLSKK
jgi:glycosyltransferase involved in cell wall biosynthesis